MVGQILFRRTWQGQNSPADSLIDQQQAGPRNRQVTLDKPITDEAAANPAREQTPNSSPEPKNSGPKVIKRLATATAVVAALAFTTYGGANLYTYMTSHETTDDAYTTAHMHPVSSRIDGTVLKVLADDNEHVKAGQILAQLDPRDYEVRVQEAQASLEVAKRQAEQARTSISLASTQATGKTTEAEGNVANAMATIKRAQSTVTESTSAIAEAQHQLQERIAEENRAQLDYTRYQTLAQQGAVSLQQRDQTLRDYQVAQEARKAAEQNVQSALARQKQSEEAVNVAQAQLEQSRGTVQQAQASHVETLVNTKQYDVANAGIAKAQSQLNDALLQLSYTKIVSPIDGRVGKKSVEEGQRLQPGQQLMNVVADDTWVVANFKETQLEKMRPHQPVEIKIDSFPHHKFEGTLDSVSPGAGSTFALLPPDNATGNFTKIVQRVPVKIWFDPQSIKGYEQMIVPGMSAVVTVAVGH